MKHCCVSILQTVVLLFCAYLVENFFWEANILVSSIKKLRKELLGIHTQFIFEGSLLCYPLALHFCHTAKLLPVGLHCCQNDAVI